MPVRNAGMKKMPFGKSDLRRASTALNIPMRSKPKTRSKGYLPTKVSSSPLRYMVIFQITDIAKTSKVNFDSGFKLTVH
jgi:hypothetical protein